MRRTYIKTAVLGLLAVLALCSCGKKATDEELIRAAINRAAEAAEAKDTAGIMKLVSKDYRDDNGLDYNGIKGVVFGEFFRPGKIKVFVTGVTVEVKGADALVTAKTALVRGKDVKSIKDILPENADASRFTLIFKKEGGVEPPEGAQPLQGDWKLVNASWESISVAGLL